jgi:hypothetical protein
MSDTELEEMEATRHEALMMTDTDWRTRAEAAEAKIAALEKALRLVMRDLDSYGLSHTETYADAYAALSSAPQRTAAGAAKEEHTCSGSVSSSESSSVPVGSTASSGSSSVIPPSNPAQAAPTSAGPCVHGRPSWQMRPHCTGNATAPATDAVQEEK